MSWRLIRRLLVHAGCTGWCVLVTPAAASAAAPGALVVGLSEQRSWLLADPRLAELPIDDARIVVPWNVATTAAQTLDAWLREAAARRLEPFVAFERAVGEACPKSCSAPSPEQYAAAFAAFRARWPAVTTFTAWNEPNHPDQPTASAPGTAAVLHDVLRRACAAACTIVAGDFVDNAAMKRYAAEYRDALTTPAQAWGIHNYGDLTYDRPSYAEWLLDQTTGPLWLTETGGIVRLAVDGEERLPYDEERAARSIDRAFALAEAHPDRIARLYLYHWQAQPLDGFDAGLVRPDGSARPSLDVVRRRLGRRPATNRESQRRDEQRGSATAPVRTAFPSGGGHASRPAGPETSRKPAPLDMRRPARTRSGLTLPVTCPAERTGGCRGTLTVSLRLHQQRREQRLGTVPIRLRPGRSAQLRLPITKRTRRRWSTTTSWRLRETATLTAPTARDEQLWRATQHQRRRTP